MNSTLRDMIQIFNPDGFDWMNFALTNKNPYTYHHILEREKGGDNSVENGAILTKRAHSFLHLLQWYYPEAYKDLQRVFRRINLSMRPVTQEYVDEIDDILEKLLITKEYKIQPDKQAVGTGSIIQLGIRIPDKDLIWESCDERIALIDKHGFVYGVKEGKANIVATTRGGVEMYNDIIKVIDLAAHCANYKPHRKIKKIG